MLLRVAQSLKLVKLFSQQLSTFLLFRDRRSVTQQCGICLHSSSNIVGATHAYYAWITKTYGLYFSHESLQVLNLLGVVVCVCTPLPTGRNNSQHCWHNNVGSCRARLHAVLVSPFPLFLKGFRKKAGFVNKTKIWPKKYCKNQDRHSLELKFEHDMIIMENAIKINIGIAQRFQQTIQFSLKNILPEITNCSLHNSIDTALSRRTSPRTDPLWKLTASDNHSRYFSHMQY